MYVFVNPKRASKMITHVMDRIERGEGVLQDQLHVTAILIQHSFIK
jgi:hypothetical protein